MIDSTYTIQTDCSQCKHCNAIKQQPIHVNPELDFFRKCFSSIFDLVTDLRYSALNTNSFQQHNTIQHPSTAATTLDPTKTVTETSQLSHDQ